ncbi:MAG: hypothetical protein KDK62_03260 [Chlamydiia bacterium]|nr:hypothetical protein [Chlamydiia bacterium]
MTSDLLVAGSPDSLSPLSCSSTSLPHLLELNNLESIALVLDAEPYLGSGHLESHETLGVLKLLEHVFHIPTQKGVREVTLRTLLEVLDRKGCLGSGDITLVGSYVIKALGSAFFLRHMNEALERQVLIPPDGFEQAFSVTPNDVDIRIQLKAVYDREKRQALMQEILEALNGYFQDEVKFNLWFNVEDPVGQNGFIISGMGKEGSLGIEILWVTQLGRRNLFEEDALQLCIPKGFWENGAGQIKWHTGETSLYKVISNRLLNRLTVLSPETVDKKGWGRLMRALAMGKKVDDALLPRIFLSKALLSLMNKKKGPALANLLEQATLNLPLNDRWKVFLTAFKSLEHYRGDKELVYYTEEDLKAFLLAYLKTKALRAWALFYLRGDRDTFIQMLSDEKQSITFEEKKLFISEMPELKEVVEAKCVQGFLGALLRLFWFDLAWKFFQENKDHSLSASKFLLGVVRAALSSPEKGRGIFFIHSLHQVSFKEKEEATKYFLLNLPQELAEVPLNLLLQAFSALTEEERSSVRLKSVYPFLVNEAIHKGGPLPKEDLVEAFKTDPYGYLLTPRILSLLLENESLELPNPLKVLVPLKGKISFFTLANKLVGEGFAEVFLEEFVNQVKELKKNKKLLEASRDKLIKLASNLTDEALLEALQSLDEERVILLGRFPERFKRYSHVVSEVEARLLNLEWALGLPERESSLTQLLLSFCPLNTGIWLRWLSAINERKLSLKREELICRLMAIFPDLRKSFKGALDPLEKLVILLLNEISKHQEVKFLEGRLIEEMLDRLPLASFQRFFKFMEALEDFILCYVQSETAFKRFRPCILALHGTAMLTNDRALPLIRFMSKDDLEQFALKNLNQLSPKMLSASIERLLELSAPKELIILSFLALQDDKEKLGAALACQHHPFLLSEIILSGALNSILEHPSLLSPILKAIKHNFWGLYSFLPLEPVFNHKAALTALERGLVELVKEANLEVFDPKKKDWRRLSADINRMTHQAKKKMLQRVLNLSLSSLPETSRWIMIGLAMRLMPFGEMSLVSGSDFDRTCRHILCFLIQAGYFEPLETTLSSLLLRGIGVAVEKEEQYGNSIKRDQNFPYITYFYHLPDISERIEGKRESVDSIPSLVTVAYDKLPTKLQDAYLKRLIFVADIFLENLREGSPKLVLCRLEVLANLLFFNAPYYCRARIDLKIQYLERVLRFITHPLKYHELFDTHFTNSRTLFNEIDRLKGLNPLHTRDAESKTYSPKFLRYRAYLSVYLDFQLFVMETKDLDKLSDYYFKIFIEISNLIQSRYRSKEIEKRTAFLMAQGLLITCPSHNFMGKAKPVRKELFQFWLDLFSGDPTVVLNSGFTLYSMFNAIIPACTTLPKQFDAFELKTLISFPEFFKDHVLKISDQTLVPPHFKDLAYLMIKLSFHALRSGVYLKFEDGGFKKNINMVLECILANLKEKEAYPTQFRRFVFLYAYMLAPSSKDYEPLNKLLGENRVLLFCRLIGAIEDSRLSYERKSLHIKIAMATLARMKQLKDEIFNALKPSQLELAEYKSGLTYCANYDLAWEDWIND